MGSISARKCLMIIDNLEKIQGIELFTAAQGFDFRKPLKSSVILDACHTWVRESIPFAESDHVMSEEMSKAILMVKNKTLVKYSGEVASGYGINLKNENDEFFGIY
jgi:histidine ammonia-lyase